MYGLKVDEGLVGFYAINKKGVIMSEDREIFVIGDLHMGDGGPRDNFAVGDKEKELNLFLDFVEKENGELVIIGDLFEFWRISLGRVLIKRLELINRLAQMQAIYVVGNHDVDLESLISTDMLANQFFKKMSQRFVKKIGDKKFMFMHGHEVDPYNKGDSPGWGRILTIFAGIFEDKNQSPFLPIGDAVEEVLNQFGETMLILWNHLTNKLKKKVSGGDSPNPESELTPAQNPKLAKKMLHRYKEDKIKEGYDIGIVGHTHKVGRLEDWYFNSGCWAEATNSFLRISDDGNVEVFDWENGKAIPNGTVLSV